ncbi:MAG TPA: hypothetical protein VM513_35385 [Kofleriaceae bacterium]|nr:hypothetical protein [Kofleriaceae bacterium]
MTTDRARSVTRPPEQLDPAMEAALVATLMRPLAPDESHHTGSGNKERELYALLAQLDVMQAFQLGRRLDADLATDALAVAFRRLLVERRQRIRAFLRDARRRASGTVR